MGSIFRAMGKPQWLTYIAVWRLATMLVLLYPAVKWGGIVGVSLLSAGVAVVDFVISAALAGRLVAAPWRAYARMLLPTLAVALVAGLVAQWVYPLLPAIKTGFRLLIGGSLMVTLYAALVWLTDAQLRGEARTLHAGLLRWARGTAPAA